MRDTNRRFWTLADFGIRLVILVLGALVLLALQLTGQLRPLQSAATQVTSPAQVGATSITSTVADVIAFVTELGTLRQRNAELAQINASLESEIFRLSEVERENITLREYFRFAQARPGLDLRGAQIVGRVIGQESTNFLDILLLDLGQEHGIEIGMPVVTDQGLVGRIFEVNSSSSKVLLITDVNSAVNALLQSSRVAGVIRGTPEGTLLMDYIQQGVRISVGEIVLTSGLGGRFPRSIPIGRVIEIRQRDIDVVQQAIVQPLIDFTRLELVSVVTNFDPLEDIDEFLINEFLSPSLTSPGAVTTTLTTTDTDPVQEGPPQPEDAIGDGP
jgi:rod shape-determining protein MreC